jgi:hypothetical protein
MTYINHAHEDKEEYNIGAVKILVDYSIIVWKNGDKYSACLEGLNLEDAESKYHEYLSKYDNVILQENQLHKIVKLSNIK